MPIHTLVVDPAGAPRGLYHDDLIELYAALGSPRLRRGSHVEPIPAGPHAGQFHADLSPVGLELCLGPFRRHGDALAAEAAWLHDHWLLERPLCSHTTSSPCLGITAS